MSVGSGSPPVQLRILFRLTFVAPCEGEGLLGVFGGLFIMVVKNIGKTEELILM